MPLAAMSATAAPGIYSPGYPASWAGFTKNLIKLRAIPHLEKSVILIAMAALQLADVLTTNHGLAASSGASELNPFLAWCMDHFGSFWWSPKLVLIGYVAVAAPRLSQRSLSFVTLFFAAVVMNNLFYI